MVVLFWLATVLPILGSGARLGIWDWDHHFAAAELERQSVLEHGVLPLWNPYLAGGLPVLQHPLGSVFAPDAWIVWLLGVPAGFKWLLALRLALGLAGAWWLGRWLGLRQPVAGLFAVLSMGSGAYTAHIVFGHAEWSLVAYVPWVLLALLRAFEAPRPVWIVGAAAGVALLFLGGNVYLLVATLLFAAALGGAEAWRRRRPRILGVGVAVGLLAAGLAGAKLLPSYEFFQQHPRESSGFKRLLSHDAREGLVELPRALHYILLARGIDWPEDPRVLFHRPLQDYDRASLVARAPLVDFVNFSAYLGVLPLLLLPLCVLARRPYVAGFALGGGLLLLLALSDPLARSLGVDPWSALQRLPLLSSLRTPGRFLSVAVVGLAALCSWGLAEGLRRLPIPSQRADAVALVALAIVAADQGERNAGLLWQAFPVKPPATERASGFETQLLPLRGLDYLSVVARTGAVAAHDNLGIRRGALPRGHPSYRGEVFLEGGEGRARLAAIGPDGVEVAVDVARPARLVVNQNHLPGWRRVDRPAPVRANRRRLETDVEPGDETVVLEYRPRLLTPGLALSALCLLGSGLWLWRSGRSR